MAASKPRSSRRVPSLSASARLGDQVGGEAALYVEELGAMRRLLDLLHEPEQRAADGAAQALVKRQVRGKNERRLLMRGPDEFRRQSPVDVGLVAEEQV